jgi:hypothetical protein
MDFFDIVPELLAMTIFFITLLVNAHLSQIFQNDFLSWDQIISTINSAILSSSKAVSVHEIILALNANPEHEPWGHEGSLSQNLIKLLEILDEIKCLIIAARIPDVILHSVVWISHVEVY